ncbi:MAG: transcriptional regulator GcvA [Candidatus Accumulibacter sp.]|uniref:transcriptional regulator GcvA n=1 Tax=Accumulibacter sp. TaxID=2053492 RepID=UPI001A530DF6|nr:transcriptional regulator GcvA [Accumulibacter sp.]MBL8393575.1 transcriptional regulator GcvA [Accumulibacter sp.]
MTYRLPPLNALRAFEAAARHLSFKDAATELSVTPTAISHQIRGLEDYLGFALFRRLTRALELTREGRLMLPRVREGLQCFAAAIESTRQHQTGGRLLVTTPPAFASRWLIRHLPGFTAEHPEVQIHMSASMETIDARDAANVSGLAGIDVRDDETEVFIRFGRGQYAGCRVDRLFSPAYAVVCSPRLLFAMRPLTVPADLRWHNLLHDESIMELLDRPSWGEWLHLAGVLGIDPDAGTHFSDPGLVLSAAIDGVGIALASKPLVEAEVAAGRLVQPFDLVIRRTQAYYLVVPEAVADRPIVDAFRQWLRREAAKVAEQ